MALTSEIPQHIHLRLDETARIEVATRVAASSHGAASPSVESAVAYGLKGVWVDKEEVRAAEREYFYGAGAEAGERIRPPVP